MLHLFNKVYLDLDDKINSKLDRAVISQIYGLNVAEGIAQHTPGVLTFYSQAGESVDYKTLFEEIKEHTDISGKRYIIYADLENFIRIASGWVKSISNMDKDSFSTMIDCFIQKEMVIQGRVWTPSVQDNVTNLRNHIDIFDSTSAFNPVLGDVNLSYEWHFATYLSDNTNAVSVTKLQAQLSMFMRRMYQELFIDIKTMVMLNILSPELQTILGGSGKTLTNFHELPKIGIFLDEDIWDDAKPMVVSSDSAFNWNGLTVQKATELGNRITEIHTEYEGFIHDSANLCHWDFLPYIIGKDLSSSELATVVASMLAKSSDYFFIPKGDFVNVNYILCTHLANLKNANNVAALTKFALK